jgi:hypothetical protein
MFGYMAAKMAKSHGFTNHGSCYGVPVWITEGDAPMVAAKFAPLEHLITLVQIAESLMYQFVYPDQEPSFQFTIGGEIK